MLEKKEYTLGDLTITWQPQKCVHSAICFHDLPEVFNPHRRPWVDLSKADTDKIIAQVKKCPSGALAFTLGQAPTAATDSEQTTANLTEINIVPSGPALIEGNFQLKKADGTVEVVSGKMALCRCGASGNKPFCDGSHKKTDFKD